MVIPPHILAILTDPFQLSLHPETALKVCLCSVYRKPIPSSGAFCAQFVWTPHLCLSTRHSILRLCPCQSSTFSLDNSEAEEAWSPLLFRLPATIPSSRSTVALVGLEGGLTGSCLHCLELVPVPSINLGMSSPPCVEQCSLLVSTYWELTWILLWWWSSKPLGQQSHFFHVEMARNSADGCPTGGVPNKGISSKGGTGRGGVLGRLTGLLEGPGAGKPSCYNAAGTSSSCCTAVTIVPLI